MAEEQQTEQKKEEAPQMTASEEKARASGWVPENEWKGDADQWVDAKEYNFRGELMDRISEQSSILNNLKGQIDERDKTIKDMVSMQSKIADREYKRALNDLKKAKAIAIEEGEGEKVVEIDEEIDALEEKRAEIEQPAEAPVAPNTPPEVVSWLQDPKNQWYNRDPFLKSVADAYAANILREHPNLTPTDVLSRMESAIKKELPHKFNGGAAPSVDDGGGDATNRTRSNQRTPRFADLDEEQQAVAKRFEKLGVMTKQEYIDELVAQGEL